MAQDKKKTLLTGGSGLLGSVLRQLKPDLLAPSEDEFDILKPEDMRPYFQTYLIETVIHAAAFTSPPLVNQQPLLAMKTNITGTANMVDLCGDFGSRLVYISTDYVFKGDRGQYREDDELLPQNLYAWSKLGGECVVRMYDKALIIRTSFCEPVFPYEKAFVDQYTSRDSVEVVAPIILELAASGGPTGIVHVGTERKTVKELAHKLGKREVGNLRRDEVSFSVPYDTSFDLSKLKSIMKALEK